MDLAQEVEMKADAEVVEELRFLKDSVPFGGTLEEWAKRLNAAKERNMEALLMYAYAAFLKTEIKKLHKQVADA